MNNYCYVKSFEGGASYAVALPSYIFHHRDLGLVHSFASFFQWPGFLHSHFHKPYSMINNLHEASMSMNSPGTHRELTRNSPGTHREPKLVAESI